MANNIKICPYCRGQVETDYDMYERFNNRYYHCACFAKKRQEDKANFEAKSKQIYNQNSIVMAAKKYLGDYYVEASVKRQATELSQKYSVKDICDALKYFYDIKQNDPSKSNGGINIVDYIINDSKKYYAEKERIAASVSKIDKSFIDGYEQLKASQPIQAVKQRIKKPKHVKYFVLE